MKKIDKKAFLITLIVTVIESIIYYLVKLVQGSPYLIGSSIDNKFPFIEYFVYFYVMWYVMLIIIPCIFYDAKKTDFTKYISLYILCSLTSNFIFMIFPTTINRANIIPNTFTLQVVDLVYFLDIPVLNCFPSMHCVASFIFMIVAIRSKNLSKISKIIINLLSILVILSTLFIKQHVYYDVISAFFIVIVYNFIYEKFLEKKVNQKLLID